MNRDTETELIDWLESHEEDIASDINDYGDLKNVFYEVVGRYPEYEGSTQAYVDNQYKS